MVMKKSLFPILQRFLLFHLLLILACKTPQEPPGSSRIPEPIIPFNPRYYICFTAGEPLRIDGRLNETAWKSADWTDDFVDIEQPVVPSTATSFSISAWIKSNGQQHALAVPVSQGTRSYQGFALTYGWPHVIATSFLAAVRWYW